MLHFEVILVNLCQIATFLNGYVVLQWLKRVMSYENIPQGLWWIKTFQMVMSHWKNHLGLLMSYCYVPQLLCRTVTFAKGYVGLPCSSKGDDGLQCTSIYIMLCFDIP